MQNFSFAIALRIWHPSIDPGVVSSTLGLTPQHECKAGELRQTAKGRNLGGVHAESFWSSDPFEHGEYLSHDDQVEDILQDVLNTLETKKDFLQQLSSQGARIHLQVSAHSNRNYAVVFPPDMLRQCSELGLSLVVDSYPYPQNW